MAFWRGTAALGAKRTIGPNTHVGLSATTGLMRCCSGAATSLNFPVAVITERSSLPQRLTPVKTAIRGSSD